MSNAPRWTTVSLCAARTAATTATARMARARAAKRSWDRWRTRCENGAVLRNVWRGLNKGRFISFYENICGIILL